tara:strand:- start:1699 stop:2073 length:375 start_codon:yes stop_codon:yes gene_type:complete
MSELNEKNQEAVDALKAEATEGLKKETVDDPTELASTMLFLYTPKFIEGVDQLSSNALRRVLKRLVQYPLNEKAYKATSAGENNVFLVGDRLLEAKFLMLMSTYHDLVQNNLPKAEEQGESDNG